jgi:aspartyl protease family protein
MTGINMESLVYLSLLGTALVFMVFVRGRQSLGKGLQHLAIWALIFLGALAAVGLWSDIRSTVMPRQSVFESEGRIVLPRAPDGHYYATLDVNGVPTRFVVDTGATTMVLGREDAARAGLATDDLPFFSEARTANGIVRTAPVRLDSVRFGPFEDRGVPAHVNGGEMAGSLLGMSYLQQFDRLSIEDGQMVLERN